MKKPLEPLPTDCCGSGCDRCIYGIYEEQMEKYNKWKERTEGKKKQKDIPTKST